jgi:hypothetical protein
MATAYVEIPLRGKKAAGRVALVDLEYDFLADWHAWYVYEVIRHGRPKGPYALGRQVKYGPMLWMHKVITGFPETDHVNHDGLDNRCSNLRDAQNRNHQNQRPKVGCSSQFKGVTWFARDGIWVAQITIGYENKYLGRFYDEVEAARAYNAAASEAFAEYACLNVLPEEQQ